MRKPILIVGLFIAIAAIALVFATQNSSNPTKHIVTKKFIPVPGKATGNVQLEWKLANPFMLQNDGLGDAYLDLRVTGKTIRTSGIL